MNEVDHKNHKLTIIISCIVAVLLIGAALLLRAKPDQASITTSAPQKKYTKQELATFNGINNKACYVAIDSKVYKIEQGLLWKNGEHTTSEGQAHCGKDLTSAIAKSPHGKSKLEALEVVGTLQ